MECRDKVDGDQVNPNMRIASARHAAARMVQHAFEPSWKSKESRNPGVVVGLTL